MPATRTVQRFRSMPALAAAALLLPLAAAASAVADDRPADEPAPRTPTLRAPRQHEQPPPQPATQPTTQPEAEDLPEAESILSDALEALGGAEAFEAVDTLSVVTRVPRGTMIQEQTLHSDRGENLRVNLNITMIAVDNGWAGDVAWSHDPIDGYKLARDRSAEVMLVQAVPMHLPTVVPAMLEHATSLQTTQRTTMDDVPVLVVRASFDDDAAVPFAGRTLTIFFDADSHLPIAAEFTERSRPVTYVLGDWERRGDVLVFTSLQKRDGGKSEDIEIVSVDVNTVDPSVFEIPEPVKKLLDEQKKPDPDDPQPDSDPAPATRPASR